ncbi:MAG: HAD family phosphatase [Lachnospiraceae bacterium]|nr:HAD family phosphatase [Lachnospiraceae bacterium]
MEFQAIVFDMDGVIFDSETKVVECWKVIADKYNIPNIEETCRECFGCNQIVAKEKFLLRYGKDFPYTELKKEMSDLFHSRYDKGRLPMKPGVIELLSYLKNNNKKIALASSTRREVVTRELRDAGILNYFDAVICGDMVTKSKPEPDIFLKACEELKIEPGKAFAIEDSHNGIKAAAKGGLNPIMVPDLMPVNHEMKELCTVILNSLLEVKIYFQNLCNNS